MCGGVVGKAFGNEVLSYWGLPLFRVSAMGALAQEEKNECGRGEDQSEPVSLDSQVKATILCSGQGCPISLHGSELSQCGQGKDKWPKKETNENRSNALGGYGG